MIITIIGNKTNPNSKILSDGQRIKTDLYYKLLYKEGFSVRFIELTNWKRRFIKLIFDIKDAIKNSDIVLIMGGPSGSRALIKLCVLLNHKNETRLVYSLIGPGTLYKITKKMAVLDSKEFIKNPKKFKVYDKKMGKKLKKLSVVMPENEILASCYSQFYNLDNVEVMTNFRYYESRNLIKRKKENIVSYIFFSRVSSKKGIFDAINAIKQVNDEKNKTVCTLDIFGDLQLTDDEMLVFNSLLNKEIKYKGIAKNEDALKILNKYDFLIFPTHFNEGTPGTIVEAQIAGLPVLSSNYSQVADLIQEGYNGFVFELGNVSSLKESIEHILSLSEFEINTLRENSYECGDKYTYEYNREKLLLYITGKD